MLCTRLVSVVKITSLLGSKVRLDVLGTCANSMFENDKSAKRNKVLTLRLIRFMRGICINIIIRLLNVSWDVSGDA